MSFTTGAALLDAVVLAIVSKEPEGAYGYKITQEIKQALDLSESTLYPVLRRLQKDGHLTAYDASCNGRNRRYYMITPAGRPSWPPTRQSGTPIPPASTRSFRRINI